MNDSKLYTKEGDVHYGQTIRDLVTGYINQLVIKYKTEEELIIGSFVQGISKVSWGPLPLYWISSVLPQIQCGNILTETSVLSLLDLVELHMVYQEPLLRGASQGDANACSILPFYALSHGFRHALLAYVPKDRHSSL